MGTIVRRASYPAAVLWAFVTGVTCAWAGELVTRLAQAVPDSGLGSSLGELCKLRATLTSFEATVEATRRQILTQRDDTAVLQAEADAALKACLARAECKASDGDRLTTRVETLFEQRYAFDRMLTTLEARLKEQAEAGKRLDSIIQGRCS